MLLCSVFIIKQNAKDKAREVIIVKMGNHDYSM